MTCSSIFRLGEGNMLTDLCNPHNFTDVDSVKLSASPPASQQYFVEPLRFNAWPITGSGRSSQILFLQNSHRPQVTCYQPKAIQVAIFTGPIQCSQFPVDRTSGYLNFSPVINAGYLGVNIYILLKYYQPGQVI